MQGILSGTESLVFKEIEPEPVAPPPKGATPEEATAATNDKLRMASCAVKSVTSKWQKAVTAVDSAAIAVADLEAQPATAKDGMAAARERMASRLAIKLEKEFDRETRAKEHKEAGLRQQEHRSERNKVAPFQRQVGILRMPKRCWAEVSCRTG